MELKELTLEQLRLSTGKEIISAVKVKNALYTFGGDSIVVFATIPVVRWKSSLQVSDEMQGRLRTEDDWPQHNGKGVDVQFLYPGEHVPIHSEPLPEK